MSDRENRNEVLANVVNYEPREKRKRRKPGSTTRYWMMTEFFDPEQHGNLNSLAFSEERWLTLPEGVVFIAWQQERCPESQRIHLQCYIELERHRGLIWLKRHISPTANFQIRRGTQQQAFDYVTKEETRRKGPYSIGNMVSTKQGERTDLKALRDAVKSGKTLRDINEDLYPTLARYTKYYCLTRNIYRPKYDPDKGILVELYIGKTRCGKTRQCYEDWKDTDFFEMSINNGTTWFDGYDGHDYVLFDDFSGASSHFRLDTTLKIWDRYPRLVPVKQTFCWWNPKHVKVTSNIHPRLWFEWENREEQYQALKERVHITYIWNDGVMEIAPDDFWDTVTVTCNFTPM